MSAESDTAEHLAKEVAREAGSLPERWRVWVYEWLREELAGADFSEHQADEINAKMRTAISVLDAAAEHLELNDEEARLAMTIKAFNEVPEDVRQGWTAKRVAGAYGGQWILAKQVAFTDKRLPVDTAQKWKRRQRLSFQTRSHAFHLSAVSEWLQLDPASTTKRAYEDWRAQHNEELPSGRRPVVRADVIQKHWQCPWAEVIKAVEENRLPESKAEQSSAEANTGEPDEEQWPDPFTAVVAAPDDLVIDPPLRARRLRAARVARGWSQSELAKRSGLNRSVIRGIESGQLQETAFESIVKLAKALGLGIDVFATDDEQTGLPKALKP